MNIKEYNKIKDLEYREYCEYLKSKYGIPSEDYFIVNKNGNLIKNNSISRGKEGLQCHHICEDIVPNLSDSKIASQNKIEYQHKNNLCYCNLLEHAWLHILIAEQNSTISNVEEGVVTGFGGIKWEMLALNSIYCNSDTSFYSSKNDEGRGFNYNFNNIITSNRKVFECLVDRCCTSAFIRQRFNLTPEEIAEQICLLCKNDGIQSNKRLRTYSNILKIAQKTKLFEWNLNAFIDLENHLKKNNSALLWICTGGGKTTTALEYLRIHKSKALILGPSNTIGDGWEKCDKKEFNYDYYNYQTFMNNYKDLFNKGKYEVLICDEAHHLDAERWSEGVKYFLDNNPNIKLIGLTATPSNLQINGNDNYFKGRICNGLDLAEGIEEGDIYPFSYIQSIYKIEDMKDQFNSYGAVGTQLWNRLNIKLNESPIENILKSNMPNGVRKIIVFVSSKEYIQYAEECLIKYDPRFKSEEYMRNIHSDKNSSYNQMSREWFNKTNDHDVCLITVGMVNEGAHYNGINTLIMFRSTNSSTLYLQQLGRIVSTTKDSLGNVKPNPGGIVFDFTNNAQNLIYKKLELNLNNSSSDSIQKDYIKRVIDAIRKKVDGKEVIWKDYTEDAVNVLSALRESQNYNRSNNTICNYFNDVCVLLGKEDSDCFSLELWDGFKGKGNSSNNNKPNKIKIPSNNHAHSKETKEGISDISKNTSITTNRISASDAEKKSTAYLLALKRLYSLGIIKFSNNIDMEINIKNEKLFAEIISQLGFKNSDIFKKVMEKSPKHTFIWATTL